MVPAGERAGSPQPRGPLEEGLWVSEEKILRMEEARAVEGHVVLGHRAWWSLAVEVREHRGIWFPVFCPLLTQPTGDSEPG